jgi:RNA polymerase sigma-70 factor, ECF subfamily
MGGPRLIPGIFRRDDESSFQLMSQPTFETLVVPHLDAAFNYARWLTHNDADAQDVVQDAAVRAFRFFSSLRSDNPRAWLLTIVRNTWYARVARQQARPHVTEYDEMADPRTDHHPDPEALLLRQQTVERVRRAVESLPVDFREVIVLRELEGLSYKDIAEVIGVPIGTVMSRLSRARERLIGLLGPTALAGELS